MSDQDRLEALLNRWEDLREGGEEVSDEELCRDCPELLGEFRRRVAELRQIDGFLSWGLFEPEEEHLTPAGRYRPLQLHACGGLGEVFTARDEELGREVALKRMRRLAASSPARSRRFQFEAEITGRLDHPGVVPVYGLGRDASGRLYYAMRFIRGQTLQQAIEQFHRIAPSGNDFGARAIAFQKLLRSFLAVCQTIGYAHSRNVIHRDLKPANIMLGNYGETLVVDWGLAKRLDEQAAASGPTPETAEGAAPPVADQTILGQVKGSPAYMSPEQAEGRTDAIGPRSDVYSLGATLYTILAGKPPFAEMAIHDLLDAVRRGDFPAPRRVRSDVPPALEAVCLKAMRRHPADRYATALELAAEVEHWLADDPVSAWREPWTWRARRWLKRHRTLATSGLTTLLATLVLLAGFLVRLNAEKDKLAVANTALQAANENLEERNRQLKAAREEAEQNLRQALQQIEETALSLARPDLFVYRHDPLYGIVEEILADQLDRFARSAPQNDFGETVRLLRNNQRLWMIGVVQPADDPVAFRNQLATTRAGLQAYLRKHPADPWADFNLAKTYVIEAQRLSSTEPANEEVATLLRDAMDVSERHATLADPYGRENAFAAAASVAMLGGGGGGPHGVENKAQAVLDRAGKVLAILDRFDAAAQSGTESDPYRRFLACLARLQALAAKANALASLKDRGGEARAAAEAGLATAGRCPAKWDRHPYILRYKAIASGMLAQNAMLNKDYIQAWDLMRQACEFMQSSLENIPGRLDEADRRWVLFSEITLAQVGAEVLRSSNRHDPASREKLLAIARAALAALDTCANAERLVPAAQRDPRVAQTAPRLLEELHKYLAELGGTAPR
jgi:serine/threonine protein kinase/FtsZ-binding cell division protein ZapB